MAKYRCTIRNYNSKSFWAKLQIGDLITISDSVIVASPVHVRKSARNRGVILEWSPTRNAWEVTDRRIVEPKSEDITPTQAKYMLSMIQQGNDYLLASSSDPNLIDLQKKGLVKWERNAKRNGFTGLWLITPLGIQEGDRIRKSLSVADCK
jgi:hypothetical protein